MSLMENLIGSCISTIEGNNQNQSNNILASVMQLVQEHGGVNEVINKFSNNGLAQQAQSWLSNGPNQTITAEHIQQVFGSNAVQNIASQLGMNTNSAGTAIAQVLPDLINKLSPNGSLPANHQDLLSEGLSILRSRL